MVWGNPDPIEVFLVVTEGGTEVVVHGIRRGHQCPEVWEDSEAGIKWDLQRHRYFEG